MFARCEDDLANRNHTLLANGLTDHGEGLLANLTVRHDVIWVVEVKLVDLFARHKFVNLDRAFALDRYGFQLFWLYRQVFAFTNFVALDDVGAFDLVPGFSVDLAILDAVAGLLVKL